MSLRSSLPPPPRPPLPEHRNRGGSFWRCQADGSSLPYPSLQLPLTERGTGGPSIHRTSASPALSLRLAQALCNPELGWMLDVLQTPPPPARPPPSAPSSAPQPLPCGTLGKAAGPPQTPRGSAPPSLPAGVRMWRALPAKPERCSRCKRSCRPLPRLGSGETALSLLKLTNDLCLQYGNELASNLRGEGVSVTEDCAVPCCPCQTTARSRLCGSALERWGFTGCFASFSFLMPVKEALIFEALLSSFSSFAGKRSFAWRLALCRCSWGNGGFVTSK